MEKRIMHTEYEPENKFLWLHTKNNKLVLEAYGKHGWESVCNCTIAEDNHIESIKVALPELNEKCSKIQLLDYIKDLTEALSKANVIKIKKY